MAATQQCDVRGGRAARYTNRFVVLLCNVRPETIRPRSLIDAFGWYDFALLCERKSPPRREERDLVPCFTLLPFLAMSHVHHCRRCSHNYYTFNNIASHLAPFDIPAFSPKPYHGFSTPPHLHHWHIERRTSQGWETPSAQQQHTSGRHRWHGVAFGPAVSPQDTAVQSKAVPECSHSRHPHDPAEAQLTAIVELCQAKER